MLRLKFHNCLPSKIIAVTEHCRMALQKTSLHQWYWGRWLLRSISTRFDCCWFTWWELVDNVNLRSSCDNSKVAMSWKTLQPICVSLCWNLQSMGTFSTMFAKILSQNIYLLRIVECERWKRHTSTRGGRGNMQSL